MTHGGGAAGEGDGDVEALGPVAAHAPRLVVAQRLDARQQLPLHERDVLVVPEHVRATVHQPHLSRAFVRAFVHSFVHSFAHSFVYSFVDLFIDLLIRSLIRVAIDAMRHRLIRWHIRLSDDRMGTVSEGMKE